MPLFAQHSFGAHVLALHTAITRHLYMWREMPVAAYVSPVTLERLFGETERICRAQDGDEPAGVRGRIYRYTFCLGQMRKTIFTHPDRDLPEALAEIRKIGLPDCATICVHYD
jgi:hypothetical protein